MNTTSVKNQDQKILSDPGKNPAHFFFSFSTGNTLYLSSHVNEWKQMLIITIVKT